MDLWLVVKGILFDFVPFVEAFKKIYESKLFLHVWMDFKGSIFKL